MRRRDAIDRLHLESMRRSDDGTWDVGLGLLLFGMGVGLDLGRVPIMMAVLVPILLAVLRKGVVGPRAGFARSPRRLVTETALLYGLSVLILLGITASGGAPGLTGPAASVGESLTRQVTLAAILALPGVLAWIAHRRGMIRYYGYAAAIAASFVLGDVVGLEARDWAIALFALAIVAIGLLRMRRFLAAHTPASESDLAG